MRLVLALRAPVYLALRATSCALALVLRKSILKKDLLNTVNGQADYELRVQYQCKRHRSRAEVPGTSIGRLCAIC